MGFPSLCSPHDMLLSEPAITFCTHQTFQNVKVAIIQPRSESSTDSRGTSHSHENLLAKLCLPAYTRGLYSR